MSDHRQRCEHGTVFGYECRMCTHDEIDALRAELAEVKAERDAMRDVVGEACHLRDEWREEYQASHADLHAVADAVDAFRAAQQEATDA